MTHFNEDKHGLLCGFVNGVQVCKEYLLLFKYRSINKVSCIDLKMDVGFLAFVKSFVLYRNETTYSFGCI